MPRLTVLQLDTSFPRIAGDVGCADTYQCELEIIKVPNATVGNIVTGQPNEIDLDPFLQAAAKATGDLITTSCGFLAPFQAHLEKACKAPFISSSLQQLEKLKQTYSPDELKIITFDEVKLNASHLPKGCEYFESSIIGLKVNSHLRVVISNDLTKLDIEKAMADVTSVVDEHIGEEVKVILLECTNLPPYKRAIRQVRDDKMCSVKIFDILTAIEEILPGAIHSPYL